MKMNNYIIVLILLLVSIYLVHGGIKDHQCSANIEMFKKSTKIIENIKLKNGKIQFDKFDYAKDNCLTSTKIENCLNYLENLFVVASAIENLKTDCFTDTNYFSEGQYYKVNKIITEAMQIIIELDWSQKINKNSQIALREKDIVSLCRLKKFYLSYNNVESFKGYLNKIFSTLNSYYQAQYELKNDKNQIQIPSQTPTIKSSFDENYKFSVISRKCG